MSEVSASQLSLAWLMAQGDFIPPIPGMKQRRYIDENLAAVEFAIPREIIRELDDMV